MTDMFKTFVINLDADTERMVFMSHQLDALDIPYERFAAVRPEEVRPKEYDVAKARARGGHELLPGELGCAASHKRILEEIIARNLEYALVLEDDVELPPDFGSIVACEIERNKGQWEYLLFDYWRPGITFIRRWFDSVAANLRNVEKKSRWRLLVFIVYSLLKGCYVVPLSLVEGFRDRYKRYSPGPVSFYRPLYLAGAYLVSYEGARKLLALASPIVYTADKLPNQARVRNGLRFLAYAPLCVRQRKDEFGSSILGLPGHIATDP